MWQFAAAGAVALLVGGCGGGSKNTAGVMTPTSTPPANTGSPTTITIANNAVSPRNLTVSRGGRVTFVNNDTQSHDMQSDPHPVHTDCPEINQVGFLTPGQSRQTGTLNNARTCGYHDHNRDIVESLQGTITVQ
jgi:plastocyanin